MSKEHNTPENQLPPLLVKASNRSSVRADEKSAISQQSCGLPPKEEGGSYPIKGNIPHFAGGVAVKPKNTKVSKPQLLTISQRLSERDWEVLKAIRKYRFLTTSQVLRLYMMKLSTPLSRLRNTNIMLKKLREYDLIQPLTRRVGGARGGSSALIWHLTEPGHRLLQLGETGKTSRKPFEEPSASFLNHTLSVAEVAVQLHSICEDSKELNVISLDPEPACWRMFADRGKKVYLKPDLYAVTSYDGYEDSWFIEMDLGTESPTQVVEKCKMYRKYYASGIEQYENEVFPLVVWIVPDKKRKERLRQYICENLPPQPKMFLVITPDQLEMMLRQYIEREELC